jgi:hypothetical protein
MKGKERILMTEWPEMLNFVFEKSGFNYGLLVYNVACGAPNASDYDRLWLGVYEESSQKD